MKNIIIFIAVFSFLTSCKDTEIDTTVPPVPGISAGSAAIDFGASQTANITVEAGKSAILVKMNFGVAAVPYGASGSVNGVSGAASNVQTVQGSVSAQKYVDFFANAAVSRNAAALTPPNSETEEANGYNFTHYSAASQFNKNPPPFTGARHSAARSIAPAIPYTEGSTKQFWVTVDENASTPQFVQRQGTLLASTAHAEVWVINNAVTAVAARGIGEKFDAIYEKETALIGYEYGGDDGSGGVDGNLKVLILVYKFSTDGIIGFFWSKDEYTNEYLANTGNGAYKSNAAEIFYMNSSIYNNSNYGPPVIYSTLAHEFQHMIHFNQKNIKGGINTSAWYNEMLSLVTEDAISPLIGIGANSLGHPVHDRFGGFLEYYYKTGLEDEPATAQHYANLYAFGAYLARNYGGAELLRLMVQNAYDGKDSITQAAVSCTGDYISFDTIFSNWAQAAINKHESGYSYNKNISKAISGVNYTFNAINILDASLKFEGPVVFYYQYAGNYITSIPAKSMVLESDEGWIKVKSPITINISRPSNPNIRLYVLTL